MMEAVSHSLPVEIGITKAAPINKNIMWEINIERSEHRAQMQPLSSSKTPYTRKILKNKEKNIALITTMAFNILQIPPQIPWFRIPVATQSNNLKQGK
jgi:hypothetical protein